MVENLISDVAKTRLRVFALATEDVSACGWLLDLLGETRQQAIDALNKTCWAQDWHPNPMQHRVQLRANLPVN